MSRNCFDLYARQPDFSEAKIGATDGKTYRIKERKRNTKKVKKKKRHKESKKEKEPLVVLVYCATFKILFYCNYISR